MTKIVRAGCALLLTAALAGCAALSPKIEAVEASTVTAQSPVSRYKEIRARIYAAEKAQLNDIAHSSTDAELRQMAQRQLLDVCLRDEQEAACEAILELRGFENPLVTVRDASVNVIMDEETLTQQECAVILELICRETGANAEYVKIIPIRNN